MNNNVAQEIQQGFNALGHGVKESGRKRNLELAAKNGYVAFKNPDAVAAFHADPIYANWTCKFEDGEYRFFPPNKKINKYLLNTEDNLDIFLQQNVVGNKNLIRAHKTDGDPSNIIKNGLFINVNNLDSSSDYISKSSLEQIKKELKNWRHGQGHYFIIIEIPQELYSRDNKDGIVAMTGEENNFNVVSEKGASFKVPSKYIRGYIDLEKKEFIENKNYAFLQDNPNRDIEIERAKKEISDGYYFDKNGNVKLMTELSPTEQKPDIIEKDNAIEDPKILETFKEVTKDPTKTTFVSVSTLQEDPSKCKYQLFTIDKRTGEKTKIQEIVVDFAGKFSMETLPSLYNQLAAGIPAIDYEKERGITFQNIDASKAMMFGNLSPDQLLLIKQMKSFVDGIYLNTNLDINGNVR